MVDGSVSSIFTVAVEDEKGKRTRDKLTHITQILCSLNL